jgi:hypothetical protein
MHGACGFQWLAFCDNRRQLRGRLLWFVVLLLWGASIGQKPFQSGEMALNRSLCVPACLTEQGSGTHDNTHVKTTYICAQSIACSASHVETVCLLATAADCGQRARIHPTGNFQVEQSKKSMA